MSLKKVKPYTIFVPGVKSIQTKKIAIGFFCPKGFLKADMSLKSSHGVLKFGYFDFLLGGIKRWVPRQGFGKKVVGNKDVREARRSLTDAYFRQY